MIAAILIGRQGSTGYPGKNVTDVLGKPLMAWPLEAASAVQEIDRIYVSTDSPQIREISKKYGARLIDRPPHLATKAALGEHAYQHAHEVITKELKKEGKTPELYVLLMANAVASTLASFGAMPNELPLSPARVWRMGQAKQFAESSEQGA